MDWPLFEKRPIARAARRKPLNGRRNNVEYQTVHEGGASSALSGNPRQAGHSQYFYVLCTIFGGYTCPHCWFALSFEPIQKEGSDMASQPVPLHKTEAGSPYCSDPNCPYCKELRRMFEQMRKDNRSVKSVSRG